MSRTNRSGRSRTARRTRDGSSGDQETGERTSRGEVGFVRQRKKRSVRGEHITFRPTANFTGTIYGQEIIRVGPRSNSTASSHDTSSRKDFALVIDEARTEHHDSKIKKDEKKTVSSKYTALQYEQVLATSTLPSTCHSSQ
ncbi:hypothetical protein BHE74_00042727 [Ensete ventricosum]|nr:hypothetical protein GW17_00030161 [Ensete ventricosum]RWW50966.1 hypothetical protein BHE74_00042727 [Ensete ventricosum]RZS01309.1 hypothetical protein BHM03_00031148 [Ensete ventricosum]